MKLSHILEGLNEQQRQAVTTVDGTILIAAGPGTGKTLTIARRATYLIQQGVSSGNILAVTFTNRAAREMRKRVEGYIGEDTGKIFIGTFHLLGLKIIQEATSNSFVIYNRDEQVNMMKLVLKGSNTRAQEAVERISRIKNTLEDTGNGTMDVYAKYQSALQQNNALDFDDLILKAIEILSSDGRYMDAFQYVMVDEYQDVNPAQYKLLRLLAPENGNICAIGDSDQAIYAFRGADVGNFLSFERDFGDAKRIVLTESYRSTGAILNASGSIIKNNLKRIDKPIKPARERGEHITVISVPDERAEGNVIVKEIEARIGGTSHYNLMHEGAMDSADRSYSFSDFAVLFRTNAQARAIEDVFSASGVPYQVMGARRKAISGIIPHLKDYAGRMEPDIRDNISMDEFLNAALNEPERAVADEGIMVCLRKLAAAHNSPSPDAIMDFINELSLLTPADDFDPRADAVTLMTIHMAKGLEFRVVFIAGVEDGLIPYTLNKKDVDMEEERRLFYVGMTRAKEELILTNARQRFIYGQRLLQSPSPFLTEIPDEFAVRRFMPDRPKERKDNQMKLF